MAEQFQTSFIPKRAVEAEQQRSFSGSGLTLFVGILALVISVVLAGGVFAYDAYLKGAVVRKRDQLQQQRKAFAPEVIRDMSRLSTKLSVAEKLLGNHIAVSGIFELLQRTTLQTIQFNSFTFANTDEGVQVSLKGEGLSFTSVALQADEFAKNSNLSQSVFSGFALDQKGNVTFSVTTIVDPKVLSYTETMGRGSASMRFINPSSSTGAAAQSQSAGQNVPQNQQADAANTAGDAVPNAGVSALEEGVGGAGDFSDSEFDELMGG